MAGKTKRGVDSFALIDHAKVKDLNLHSQK